MFFSKAKKIEELLTSVIKKEAPEDQLLALIAKASARDLAREDLLLDAAVFGKLRVARALMDRGAAHDENSSLLVAAITCGNADMARQGILKLAATTALSRVSMTFRDGRIVKNLIAAGEDNAAEMVQMLVLAGADVNKPCPIRTDTPLHAAARRNDARIIKTLAAAGAKTNVQNKDFHTPLMCAAHDGNLAAVQALLKAGASPDIVDSRSWEDIFLRQVPDPWDACDANGNIVGISALYLAAEGGHTAVAQELLDAGANTGIKNMDGNDAKSRALAWGCAEIAAAIDAADFRRATKGFREGTAAKTPAPAPLRPARRPYPSRVKPSSPG